MSLPQSKILASLGTANRIARTAETHPLTYRLESGEPVVDLKAYEALAGYAALRKAVAYAGERIVFYTGWGSTETAPTSTGTYWDTERVGRRSSAG